MIKFGEPSMTNVSIYFYDSGPDKDGRRRYSLHWWSVSQERNRSQEFNSRDWSKHSAWAETGHN